MEKVRLLGLLFTLSEPRCNSSVPLCGGLGCGHTWALDRSRRGLHFESFILVNAVLGRPKGLTDLKHGPLKHIEGLI